MAGFGLLAVLWLMIFTISVQVEALFQAMVWIHQPFNSFPRVPHN
jgi:hypothetical protein